MPYSPNHLEDKVNEDPELRILAGQVSDIVKQQLVHELQLDTTNETQEPPAYLNHPSWCTAVRYTGTYLGDTHNGDTHKLKEEYHQNHALAAIIAGRGKLFYDGKTGA